MNTVLTGLLLWSSAGAGFWMLLRLALAMRAGESAARRRSLVTAVLLTVAIFPLLVWIGPRFEWAVLPATDGERVIVLADTGAEREISTPGNMPLPALPAPAQLPDLLPAMLLGVWLLGAAVELARFLIARAALGSLVREGVHASDGPWRRETSAAAALLGMTNPPEVVVVPRLLSPLLFGLRTSAIAIPSALADIDPAARRAILMHELMHLRQRDLYWLTLAHLLAALHWFNPALRTCARLLEREQERACDDAVLRTGEPPHRYASLLLTAGDRCRAAYAGFSGSDTADRLRRILDPRRNRRAERGGRFWLLTVGMLAAAAAIAGLRLVPAVAAKAPTRQEDVRVFTSEGRELYPRDGVIVLEQKPEPAPPKPVDPRSRVRDIESIGGVALPDALSQILKAAVDNDPFVRQAAMKQLAWVDDERAVSALESAVADVDPFVRQLALQALLDRSAAIDPRVARRALADGDPFVRMLAVRLAVSRNDRDAQETLREALEQEDDPFVARWLRRAIEMFE